MNLIEYVQRNNTHQTHIADLIFLGDEGIDEMNDKFKKIIDLLKTKVNHGINLSMKIDGAPAVQILSHVEGYPDNCVGLKSLVKNPDNALSSVEEIDTKYGDRPDMAEKLKQCLRLAKCIPEGEIWQGDCLFSKNDLKELDIKGTKYLTFHPNKIVYAVSEKNKSFDTIKNSTFGICFHTRYYGTRQSFNVSIDDLTGIPNDIYVTTPALYLDKKDEKDYSELESKYDSLLVSENKLLHNPQYEDLCNNNLFMNYWNNFVNHNLSDNHRDQFIEDSFIDELKEFVKNKQEAELEKKLQTLKTEMGKEKAREKFNQDVKELSDIIENNLELLKSIVSCFNKATEVKSIIWNELKGLDQDYSTFYKHATDGYIPAEPEGISVSDDEGNITKIVDRAKFSNINRDPNYLSGFYHEELLLDSLSDSCADFDD